MKDLQKMGGIAALIEAATYIIGFALVFTVLADFFTGDIERAEAVEFLVDNYSLMYVWHMLIYVVNGIFLVVLVVALHDRLKSDSPALMQTASAFGMIWAGLVIASGMLILINLGTIIELHKDNPAEAGLAWETFTSIENGLGGGVEIVGGVWILLMSWAALSTTKLPKSLNYLGLVIGVAGILTIIPPIADIGAVFGLGFIVWFAWTGIILLRGDTV